MLRDNWQLVIKRDCQERSAKNYSISAKIISVTYSLTVKFKLKADILFQFHREGMQLSNKPSFYRANSY